MRYNSCNSQKLLGKQVYKSNQKNFTPTRSEYTYNFPYVFSIAQIPFSSHRPTHHSNHVLWRDAPNLPPTYSVGPFHTLPDALSLRNLPLVKSRGALSLPSNPFLLLTRSIHPSLALPTESSRSRRSGAARLAFTQPTPSRASEGSSAL